MSLRLVTLGLICSSFSSFDNCDIRLFIWDCSSFLSMPGLLYTFLLRLLSLHPTEVGALSLSYSRENMVMNNEICMKGKFFLSFLKWLWNYNVWKYFYFHDSKSQIHECRGVDFLLSSVMCQDNGKWELAIPYPPLVPRTKSGLGKHLLRLHILGRKCQMPLPPSVGISHACNAVPWDGWGVFPFRVPGENSMTCIVRRCIFAHYSSNCQEKRILFSLRPGVKKEFTHSRQFTSLRKLLNFFSIWLLLFVIFICGTRCL